MPQQVMQTSSKEVPYWTVANGFDTMFSLWNPTDQGQDMVAIFYFGAGQVSMSFRFISTLRLPR